MFLKPASPIQTVNYLENNLLTHWIVILIPNWNVSPLKKHTYTHTLTYIPTLYIYFINLKHLLKVISYLGHDTDICHKKFWL
jgi:hypothetical protein